MKKYGNDYRQRGKQFEYTGKWYGSSLSVKELKRHALNNTGLMAAALVIYFASLMLNNEGSRIFWILLPYMVVVFPVSYGIMGGVSLFLFCRQQEGKADFEIYETKAIIKTAVCSGKPNRRSFQFLIILAVEFGSKRCILSVSIPSSTVSFAGESAATLAVSF